LGKKKETANLDEDVSPSKSQIGQKLSQWQTKKKKSTWRKFEKPRHFLHSRIKAIFFSPVLVYRRIKEPFPRTYKPHWKLHKKMSPLLKLHEAFSTIFSSWPFQAASQPFRLGSYILGPKLDHTRYFKEFKRS